MAPLDPKDNVVFLDKREHKETLVLTETLVSKALRVWLDSQDPRVSEVNLEFAANLDSWVHLADLARTEFL